MLGGQSKFETIQGKRRKRKRRKKEREERGGGRGSTYEKGAATTSACYDTSTPQGGMASRSRDQNVVGVSRVGGQPLIRTVAVTEYATISTLDELINNINVAVGTNKTYQSYIPCIFVNVKGRKMTKKELQSRGNQKEQKEGRKVRDIRKAYRKKERERKMKEFEKAMRKGHKWQEKVVETEEELK